MSFYHNKLKLRFHINYTICVHYYAMSHNEVIITFFPFNSPKQCFYYKPLWKKYTLLNVIY